MTVYFVCPWIPSRIRPRSLSALRAIREQGHRIEVLAIGWHGERESDVHALSLDNLTIVQAARFGGAARALKAGFSSRSLQQSFASSRAFLNRTAEILSTATTRDVVHFNVARSTGGLLGVRTAAKVVVDLDDVRSDYYVQLRNNSSALSPRYWVARIEAKRMAALEQQIALTADAVVLSSPRDVGRLPGNVLCVPSGHEITEPIGPASSTDGVVLFVGRLSYGPNQRAVAFLRGTVMPEVRRSCPSARLLVVGSDPPRWMRKMFHSGPDELHPNVESTVKFYGRAAVNVVPVSEVTGVQMKLIQGLAAGVPCISTALAAEQAGLLSGKAVLTADSAPEWVEAIVQVLTRPELGRLLSEQGVSEAQRWTEASVHAAWREVYASVGIE